jgi:hypothetical protein
MKTVRIRGLLTSEKMLTRGPWIFALHYITGIGLLLFEYPVLPAYWWGWIVPFLLPFPISIVIFRYSPKSEPSVNGRVIPENNHLFFWQHMLKMYVFGYFILIGLAWFLVRQLIYSG